MIVRENLFVKPLPAMAQVSCVQGFVQTDFDGDGTDEVLAAGNFYPYRVQLVAATLRWVRC